MSLDTLREELDWVCRPMVQLPSVFIEDFCGCLDKLTVMLEEDVPTAPPPPPSKTPDDDPMQQILDKQKAQLSGQEPDAEPEDGWSSKLNDFIEWLADMAEGFPRAAPYLNRFSKKLQTTNAPPVKILAKMRTWAKGTMFDKMEKRGEYLKAQWGMVQALRKRLISIVGQ